jgi:hypothetical protein
MMGAFILGNHLKPTRHEDVFGCLKYSGPPLSIEDMEQAILEEARQQK